MEQSDIPVIGTTNTRNVIIQECLFLYSMGQVIKLTEVSGYVNITNCIFMNSNHYEDHGTSIAIENTFISMLEVYIVTMKNCNFSSNKGAKSVFYIENYDEVAMEYSITIPY